MTRRIIEITPDASLIEDIGAASYTVEEAIVELVANSLDARVAEQRLHIDVRVSDAEIAVIDDGVGMDGDTLMDAVRLGVKMEMAHPSQSRRKGMFGLGMKTACASMGRYWAVVTRPDAGPYEYRVEFDLKEWRAHAGQRGFQWQTTLEEIDRDAGSLLGTRPHGTAVIVRRLREERPLVTPVLMRLGDAYKPHIADGDLITVNGQPAQATPYNLIPGATVNVDIVAGPDSDQRITGWVGLDRQTHNAGDFGLNLYRERQLIEPWNKEWFKVHLMTSRIMGEINLDFVPANFHKRGFQKQSPEWKLATETMRLFLLDVVRASREVSRGRGDTTRVVRAISGLRKALGAAVEVGIPDDLSPDDGRPQGAGRADGQSTPSDAAVQVTADSLVLPDGAIHLTFRVEMLISPQTPWDYIYDPHRSELQAVLNQSSPLFERVADTEFLATLSLADSVSRFLTEKRGFSADSARKIRDRWLFAALVPKSATPTPEPVV